MLLWLVFLSVSPACSCHSKKDQKVRPRLDTSNKSLSSVTNLLELNLQSLALLGQLQKLLHDLVLLLSSLLEVSSQLGDDAVPLFQGSLKILKLWK